ncbi:MAG: glycosyltransferase, partial [Candidatus Acidiferrales bacterium]
VHCFSAVIVANPTTAERFPNSRRITIVQNFPLLSEFPPVRRPQEDDRNSVVYVGLRLTEARGVVDMVRAMGLLRPGLDLRLKLVGEFDPPELLADLEQIPGWDKVDCLGMRGRKEVSEVLRQAKVGLSVLHPEPNYVMAQPVKLFEYMGAYCPVIASDFPVVRRIVDTVRCGILIEPRNPKALAEAIEYLVDHPQEANEMGERGRQAVETRFNWMCEEEALLELYENLESGGTRPVPASVPRERQA